MNNEYFNLEPTKYTLKKMFERTDTKEFVFRHGHIAITNYTMRDNPEFEKSLSIFDEINWKYHLCGGYYIEELKEFRVNRGYDVNLLHKFFPTYKPRIENDAYPYDDIDIDLLVPPKNDFQRVALTFMASKGQYKSNSKFTQQIIDADTGMGKAQPDDTLIPTPSGHKRLDQLKIGDIIFNQYGEPVKVLAIYPQKGLQDTYEVTFKDGRTSRCNPEHLWKIIDQENRCNIMPLSDIIKNYKKVTSDGKHTGHRYAVPIPGPVHYKNKEVPVDPYVLGVLIGNGCLEASALTISSGNLYVPSEIAKRIKHPTQFRRFKNNYSYKFIIDSYIDKNNKERFNYVQTKSFLKDIPELINSKSESKFIPDIYKYNSIEVRQLLLQGLMDTDGHISKDKYKTTYTTVSTRLKDDIVELVRSLGYLTFVTEDARHYKYSTGHCYRINIVCPDKDKPKLFRVNPLSVHRAKIASETYKTRRRDDVLTIMNIKKVKPTKQRCIYIDDPSHIYLTENFIPTHNTYCGIATSCYLSAKTIIFVPFSKLLDQWKEAYLNFTSIKENEILIVKGSKICKKVIDGEYKNIKIFIVMVDTIYSFVKHYGNLECIEFLRATGAYIKIVDEIHRDMKTISMLEALSNFQMNYYMSASPGRSDKKENWIFKSLFRNIPKFGSKFKMEEEKHLNIIIKKYNFSPDSKQMKKMINRKGWLNVKCYETEMFNSPDYQKNDFNESLIMMLNWSKNLLKPDNKIMILVNTIAGTAYIQNIAEKIFPGETARYYGTMKSESDKQKALKSRIICATVNSLGTGADIKNIQFVYNCTTYSNWIDATQVSGRARKLSDGTQVVYCELVNFGFRKTVAQYEKRKPYLVKRAKTGRLMIVD